MSGYQVVCPTCGAVDSMITGAPDEETGWRDWLCDDCGHVFGGIADRGMLDLGIIREATTDDLPKHNNYEVFYETFEGTAFPNGES